MMKQDDHPPLFYGPSPSNVSLHTRPNARPVVKFRSMVNVVSRKCSIPGCGKGPSYGRDGDRKASYCAVHKREGDVNLTNKRDGYSNPRYFARAE